MLVDVYDTLNYDFYFDRDASSSKYLLSVVR